MSAISIARSRLRLSAWELDGPGLLLGVLYLVFFCYGFASFTDPDYFWHMRTGRLIVDELSVPQTDVFSFTAEGHRWIVHEWLSEVFIYLSVSHLGYAVTLGVFLILILASFALMQRLLLRLGTPPIAVALLVPLGIMISLPFWTVRPQVFTWFFIALFTSTLFERKQPAWLLVPAMALWANMHLGFMFGLAICGMWFVSRLWERQAGEGDFDVRKGALFLAACFAATLLNPNGPLLYSHALPFLPGVGSAADLQSITEWSSPNFHEALHYPLLLGIGVLMALSLSGRVRDRFAALLAISFMVLALYAARYQPLFAIAFLPAAGLAARELQFGWLNVAGPSRAGVNWALIGLTAVAVVIAIPMLPHPQLYREPRADGRVLYPQAALALVEEQRPDANVFTDYTWGGYFLNALYPEGHVYIDGRADMYGGDVLHDYQSITSAMEGWQEQLDSSGADVVVVEPYVPLARALRDAGGWTLAFEDGVAVVFTRDGLP